MTESRSHRVPESRSFLVRYRRTYVLNNSKNTTFEFFLTCFLCFKLNFEVLKRTKTKYNFKTLCVLSSKLCHPVSVQLHCKRYMFFCLVFPLILFFKFSACTLFSALMQIMHLFWCYLWQFCKKNYANLASKSEKNNSETAPSIGTNLVSKIITNFIFNALLAPF